MVGRYPANLSKDRILRECRLQPFTVREGQIVDVMRSGASNKAIACRLGISEGTVKIHVSKMLRKLHIKNRTQLAVTRIPSANSLSIASFDAAQTDDLARTNHPGLVSMAQCTEGV